MKFNCQKIKYCFKNNVKVIMEETVQKRIKAFWFFLKYNSVILTNKFRKPWMILEFRLMKFWVRVQIKKVLTTYILQALTERRPIRIYK